MNVQEVENLFNNIRDELYGNIAAVKSFDDLTDERLQIIESLIGEHFENKYLLIELRRIEKEKTLKP